MLGASSGKSAIDSRIPANGTTQSSPRSAPSRWGAVPCPTASAAVARPGLSRKIRPATPAIMVTTDAGVTWRKIRDASFFNIFGNFRQALGMGGKYAASRKLGQAESHGPAIVGRFEYLPDWFRVCNAACRFLPLALGSWRMIRPGGYGQVQRDTRNDNMDMNGEYRISA